MADLDVEAQLITPSVTYGVTPDLDVNLTLPLIRTSLGVHGDRHGARSAPAAVRARAGRSERVSAGPIPSASESAVGVGDLLLRAKYVVAARAPVDLAARARGELSDR